MEEKEKEKEDNNKNNNNDNNQKQEQIENQNEEKENQNDIEQNVIIEKNEPPSSEPSSDNKKEENSSNLYKESSEPFMQVKSKELITCLNEPENRKCFDCGESPANWICVNNAIFLCGKCAGEHRGYGAIISNLKFIMLDKLNEFQVELMKRGGNKLLDNLLNEYKIDKNKTDKLILYSSRLLEYHRDYLYNKLAGKDDPKPPNKFDSTKIMSNFKDNPRPHLDKIKTKDEIFKGNDNQKKDNKKGNCKVQ
jgi:hypothetical protein